MKFIQLSDEEFNLLKEIIEYEDDIQHWKKRFDKLSKKEDVILRGCFKELKDKELIAISWADNIPYRIQVLKDGYFYEHNMKNKTGKSTFEEEISELIKRTDKIKSPINVASVGTNIDDYNYDSEIWMNDVEIFYKKYLKKHALASRIETLLFHRKYKELVACLESIRRDKDFIDKMDGLEKVNLSAYKVRQLPEYDVFISHANKDKEDFVEELYQSINELGINIFYDKESLEWGDNWKNRILEGTKKSEFAIIVISKHFFGREWTEKELYEFLSRQNRDGQKIILPILHNITPEQLRDKYNLLADIQAISSDRYSSEQIALMFAKQLIKRLKSVY